MFASPIQVDPLVRSALPLDAASERIGRHHPPPKGVPIRSVIASTALLVLVVAEVSGCISVNSPGLQEHLKTVSAGHTGCAPEDNVISNINAKRDGSGTWNATCRGKTYLCSAVATVGHSEAYSCAPVAQ